MKIEDERFIKLNRNTSEFYLVLRYKQGHCPGTFYRKLFEVIMDADTENRGLLRLAFPIIVGSLDLYKSYSVEEIIEKLRG